MSGLAIASIMFGCVFGGALGGMFMRSVLPEHHLDDHSKNVVIPAMGLVATMAALVLGLLVASAKTSYDEQRSGLDQISSDLILVDATLALYGREAQEARDLLRRGVALGIQRIWPEDASQAPKAAPETIAEGKSLYAKIQELSPANDTQRELRSQALEIAAALGRARWLLGAQQQSSSIAALFLVILVFWLTAVFASFGLFAPRNATVVATLFVSALSVSGAVFLILELAEPFDGAIQIPSDALRAALAQIGR